MQKLIDLTQNLDEKTVLFPGDSIFKRTCTNNLADGDDYTQHDIDFSCHSGTHIDFPAHIVSDGKTSSDYDINDLAGNAVIIEISPDKSKITPENIINENINPGDFVLFKTRNSELIKNHVLDTEFVYLTREAAELLVERKVALVGIDYLSVDKIEDSALTTHHILLPNNVLILEGINLYNITGGAYDIFIAPIKIPNMDGLPVRVFAMRKE
ncbi:MAG: cyclase family protein [Gammaproteobacteria bacterium]|nr:cyclase family protein [Gammaproteobacteria bacterium]